ncbi:MAG: Gfo/Idh/MocA family oxidoreductase [Fulvivirga sp.]|uniref:Gfo/Idh/MocA family protein n=1 Tax=Fulvivirga sp. TaxID=1931237 RepID=UPI0032ED7E98
MKVLVIGLGSIAQKHIRAIRSLEQNIKIFALRSLKGVPDEDGVENIYNWADVPEIDFVIISNPSSLHYETIEKAIELKVPLFIEKPPLVSLEGATQLINKIEVNEIATYVAFNMRFHPVIIWTKEYIRNKRILEVFAYCGSFLPDWRPENDYKKVYSARQELGGGVHLDLIHEIDYLIWLFGKPLNSSNQIRKISDLDINSIDSAIYILNYEKSVVQIMLNYFRRDPQRKIEIVFDDHSIMLDLIKGLVKSSGGEILFESHLASSTTYFEQMRYFIDCLKSDTLPVNSLKESLETLKICLNEKAS